MGRETATIVLFAVKDFVIEGNLKNAPAPFY